MQVVLDSSLELHKRYRNLDLTDPASKDVENFGQRLLYKASIKGIKGTIGAHITSGAETLELGYLGLVSDCYSRHEKLTLQPHDLWFIVLTELAREINANSDKYRSLFTASDKKTAIEVPGFEHLNVLAVVEHLTKLVQCDITAFLPSLSTAGEDVVAAFAASFCDAVQSYYSYGTFCCGIPEIKATGTPLDWANLIMATIKLQAIFQPVGGPIGYLETLSQLFTQIAADVASGEPNAPFWKGIFTARNVGSGGELEISGWIKDLYLAKRPGPKLANFEVSLGVVPYTNLDTGREFTAIYGAFGAHRDADGFLFSSYDHFVFERTPKE